MTLVAWFQVAGATTFGCLAAASFIYAIVCAARLKRNDEQEDNQDGDHSYDVPYWLIAALLLPTVLILKARWSLTY